MPACGFTQGRSRNCDFGWPMLLFFFYLKELHCCHFKTRLFLKFVYIFSFNIQVKKHFFTVDGKTASGT